MSDSAFDTMIDAVMPTVLDRFVATLGHSLTPSEQEAAAREFSQMFVSASIIEGWEAGLWEFGWSHAKQALTIKATDKGRAVQSQLNNN